MGIDGINFKGNINDNHFEIDVKIYLSREFEQEYNGKISKVYLVRINRMNGDYITFWKIKQKIVDNVLSKYGGLPSELWSENRNNRNNTDYNTISIEYDYSVYDDCQQMMDEEDSDDDMVWI